MTKRWLGLLLLGVVWIGRSGVAHALTASPDPIPIGSVTVGQSGTATTTLTANPDETVATFDLTAPGCTEFQVTPPTPLPLIVGTGGGPTGAKVVTVSLTPTSRGAKSCQITARDSGGAALGNFTATGTGVAPAVGVLPTSFDFGGLRIANALVTTATKTFAISNNGDGGSVLTVTNITFSDAAYTLQPAVSFPLTINSGASQNVTVQFDPSTAGAHPATMTIASDDPVTPNKGVALSGTGTNATVAAADANFGTVNINTTGSQNVAVTNAAASSPGLLTVLSATITGSAFFSFGTTQGCTGGTSCTFTQPFSTTTGTLNVPVRCSPGATGAGTQTGTITITSDGDAGGTTTAQLMCTAGRPNIMVSTNTLSFGTVPVGSTSAGQIVTIMNTGNTALTYSLSKNPNLAQFAIAGCTSGCSIAGGGMATFTVTFSPTAIGLLSTRIDITNNDPDPGDSPFPINASGTGGSPQIGVAPTTLTFTSTEVGRTSTSQTVTATNNGNATLTINSATFQTGGADYTMTAGQAGTQTVAAGTSVSWDIACKPSAQGSRTGTFRISSNSLTGATTDVGLSCTGLEGVIATTPTSLDFGGVAQGTTKNLTFTLKNTGNVSLTGIVGALNNTLIGYQFNTASVPSTLAAGAQTTLSVTFAPQSGNDGGPATITFTADWGSFGSTTTAVLQLNGDGLTTGYDVSPMAIDFGDFRFDTRPTKVYSIINSGQASVTIQTQTFTPDAGTASTEYGFVIKRGTSTVSLPQTLSNGQQLDVTVTAQPNSRIGLVSGHVDIHSDLNMNPDRRVTLTGNATTAGISFPALVDFGAVDVDGPAVTQTIMILNNGAATLDVSSITKMTGASPAFTVTLPTTLTQVSPNTTLALNVTYKPTIDMPVNQPDTMVLVANLAGIVGGPSQAMITVKGHGIDRHLIVDPVEQFPPTFRNPGDKATVKAITVHNNGEATLRILGVMVTGDPIWQLVDSAAIDIPGGGAHDFLVKFSPTTIGAAPTGTLTLVNDDNQRAMAKVTLDGNGIDRSVAFGPAEINLGYTGVGIPLTVTDLLTVTNMEPSAAFTISAIRLDGDAAFTIDGAPAGVLLDASSAKQFSLTFEPTAAGTFRTTAHLLLDQGVDQGQVTITGNALFIDAHGSGGCNTGGTRGGGGLVIGLALLGLLRRRRRAGLGVAAAIVAVAAIAHADGVELAVFEPTPATTGTSFQLQPPDVGVDGSWVANATMSYASNPLVLDERGADGVPVYRDAPIERSSLFQIGGAYALLGRFEVGAHLPMYQQSGQPPPSTMVGSSRQLVSGTARGNLALHAKARLLRARLGLGTFVAGASAIVVVPTATKDQFTGSDQLELRLLGLGSFTPAALGSRLAVSVNLGSALRGDSGYGNVTQGNALAWGVGASYRILDSLWATAELFGMSTPSGQRQQEVGGMMRPALTLSPVEGLAGLTIKPDRRITIGLALGRGVTGAVGTPDLRGVLSLSVVPGAGAIAPIPRELPRPDGDADGDGIPDSVDKCPNEPEDKDMFEDGDGCPDPDNDHDGIPDKLDKCPLDPEDKDGFQDDDGCPDKDNDGDGIPDAADKCPNEPEDKDGFQDVDGCPDPDNDNDGIPDDKDKCPNEPETINGFQDDDGCPDKGDTAIILSPDRIETLDPIQFTGVKLTRQSTALLGQVAATLRAHSEIVRLRVTVHVQPSGDPDADQARSDKRAQAIREWLVQWGIAPTRLEARGFGGAKPLVPPAQRGAAKINDRLELIILERK